MAEPGLVSVIPGSGVIMMGPVSVCHQVSTIGQRSPPITLWYQSQALGLIGSPTEPSSRSEEIGPRGLAPHFIKVRIAVGAA